MSVRSITRRMQALRIDVNPDVEERHVAAILRELGESPLPAVPVRRPGSSRRRLAVAMVTAVALLLPAVALAAEESVPGDLLYPVKQSTEWARSLIVPGAAQQHRVRELEIVIERGAPIDVVTNRFNDAVDMVGDGDVELVRRVEKAQETVRERYGVELDRVPDTSAPATTTIAPDLPGERGGMGSDGGTGADGTITRSTIGQPDHTPEPGSDGGALDAEIPRARD